MPGRGNAELPNQEPAANQHGCHDHYDNDGDLDLYVTRAGQGGGETAFNRGRLLEYQSKNSKFETKNMKYVYGFLLDQ